MALNGSFEDTHNMTSLFQVIAHEDNNDQTKLRQATALAHERVEDRFGAFVRQGSVDDQAVRYSLVEEDVKAVVANACAQVGYADADGIYKALANNFVTADALPQLRTASVRHEARKPKMCPYHSEVTDISLAAGDPQAGFNAMAQHAWSAQHCQGADYKGDRCKFKPAMTTQAYWDEKAEKAEQRRNERAEREEQMQQEAPVNELPEVETPEEDFVDELAESDSFDGPEEPSAIGVGTAETEGQIPMSMAASTVHTAPGGAHLPGASDKRNRQYEHIKEQCLADGGSEEHCKELAARTVNKQRAEHGETKSHVAASPSPKMDKRKWTPKTVNKDQPLNADKDSGPHPTRRKDIVEPIRAQNDDGLYHTHGLEEIGEQVTERQDATEKGGPAKTDQGGTFTGGPTTAVSKLLDTDSVKTALAKFKRD
jgi:hypothetical protein